MDKNSLARYEVFEWKHVNDDDSLQLKVELNRRTLVLLKAQFESDLSNAAVLNVSSQSSTIKNKIKILGIN